MDTFRYPEQVLLGVENDVNLVIILQTLQNVSIKPIVWKSTLLAS